MRRCLIAWAMIVAGCATGDPQPLPDPPARLRDCHRSGYHSLSGQDDMAHRLLRENARYADCLSAWGFWYGDLRRNRGAHPMETGE